MSVQRFQSLKPSADLPQLQKILATKKPQNGLSPQGSWFAISNKSEAESEVHIYDFIGEYGVTATDFARDFSAIRASRITLRINSPGGECDDGIAIFNAIRRHPANVTAFIDGIAASAASFIALAADRVVMMPHSKLMIHDAQGFVLGPADDMRQMADVLDLYSDDIAAIYASKAGGTTADWRARMKAETWMSDREAVELGLADAIDGEEDKPKAIKNELPDPVKVDWSQFINAQMEDATLVA